MPRLQGAFAIAFLFRDHPDLIIGARQGAPLTVGYGEGENYLGSDALAVAPWTQRIAYLEEGDWAAVRREGIEIFDTDNRPVTREIVESGASSAPVEKGNYAHYMQKEIFEQPIVVAQTLQSYVRPFEGEVALPVAEADLESVDRLTIVACGTSYYAGLVAKYWVERFARVPVDIDVASEFRYRQPVLEPGGLALFISQSGETADTLAALRHARSEQQRIAVVVNVPTSSMAREADLLFRPTPGPRSASLRPRPSPASWRCSRRSPPTSRGPRAGSAVTRRSRSSSICVRRRRRSTQRSTTTRTSPRWRI